MLVEDCRECDGCSPDEREGSNRPSGKARWENDALMGVRLRMRAGSRMLKGR